MSGFENSLAFHTFCESNGLNLSDAIRVIENARYSHNLPYEHVALEGNNIHLEIQGATIVVWERKLGNNWQIIGRFAYGYLANNAVSDDTWNYIPVTTTSQYSMKEENK